MDELEVLRAEIDRIDEAILGLLAQRFDGCRQLGIVKAERGLPMRQPTREHTMLARRRGLAEYYGVDPYFAEQLFRVILVEGLHIQVNP